MVAVLAAGIIIAPLSGAQEQEDPTPYTCDARGAAKHIKLAKGTANAGFSKKRWRHGPKRAQIRRIGDHLRCLERGKDRKAIKRHVASKRSWQRLYRRYRSAAPFPGYRGRGVWLTHLAVPRYIVDCESGGSWYAYNPSGASWLYQLLGWGAPRPDSAEAKVRNHEIAHDVSSGSRNFSPWVCA